MREFDLNFSIPHFVFIGDSQDLKKKKKKFSVRVQRQNCGGVRWCGSSSPSLKFLVFKNALKLARSSRMPVNNQVIPHMTHFLQNPHPSSFVQLLDE